jgi:hypothetical protein
MSRPRFRWPRFEGLWRPPMPRCARLPSRRVQRAPIKSGGLSARAVPPARIATCGSRFGKRPEGAAAGSETTRM